MFPVVASLRMALAPPVCQSTSSPKKMFCSSVQKIGRSFSFLVERSTSIRQPSVSEYSLSFADRMDADHRSVNECSFMDPGLTIGHFLNTIQTLDIFCRSRRQFCRSVTCCFYSGFSNFVKFARHFLPLQFLCQNLPKNILPEILNNFNMLQIFYFGADFGTGHAIHTGEHDENHPFTGGAAGNR